MNETLAADLNASTRKAPNFQPSAALVRPVPVPLTPFLSPPEYPWSDSERCVTNALLGLFANFRLSIRIPSLAVWSKAGTNVRKWLRLLRLSFSSPYEVCFMEKKKSKWGWRASWKKVWASIFDLKTTFLKSPHPQDCFGLQSAQRQHQQSSELSQHTADSHHSPLVLRQRS